MFLWDPVTPSLSLFFAITDCLLLSVDGAESAGAADAAARGEKVSIRALRRQRNPTAGLLESVSNKHNRSAAVRACHWTEQTGGVFFLYILFYQRQKKRKISDLNSLNLVFMGRNDVVFF